MSNVRLSTESLLYYKQSKNNANKGRHPFVSFVQDSSDTDQESDSRYSDKIVLTPRLKAHSKKHQPKDNIQGVTPLRSIAENLGKKLADNVLHNTPSRILQLALQGENEESQDDFNGFGVTPQTKQIKPSQTSLKTQQKSIKNQEDVANNADNSVESRPKRKVNEDSVTENELSDSESKRAQQLENNREEETVPNVYSKRKTTASARLTAKKGKMAANLDSNDSFEPEKKGKKAKPAPKRRGKNTDPPMETAGTSKPPTKKRGKINSDDPPIDSAVALKPPAKGRRKKNTENPSTETDDASEPASKRARVASKTKDVLTVESDTFSLERVEKNQASKVNLRGKKVSINLDAELLDASPRKLRKKPVTNADPKPRGQPKKSSVPTESGPPDTNSPKTMDPGYSNQSISADITATVKESEAPQVENVLLSLNKSTYKSPEKKFNFSSSSESEEEDDEDDNFIFPSKNLSRKTTSPKIAALLDIFQTPTVGINKVSKLASPKSNTLASSSVPLLPTPRRSRSLAKQFLLNRDELSDTAEDVADTEEHIKRTSRKKTPLKTTPASKIATPERISNTRLRNAVIPKQVALTQFSPSTSPPPHNRESSEGSAVTTRQSSDVASKTPTSSKRLRTCLNLASQKRNEQNDPENDLSEDDSGRIPSAKKRTSDVMLQSGDSMYNRTQFGSAIEPSTLPVPRTTRFNLYMTPLDDPVRAFELHSGDDYRVSWLYLLPNVVFPLKTRDPITIIQLKGSVEFRNNPAVPSRIILNSSTRLVELKAGLFLHVVNTGKEVASFQITEMLC